MNLEDYNEYYIQGSDHYLIPKDVFKELFNEMSNWKEESQKQKEVIERLQNIINELEEYINKTKLEEFEKEYGKRYGKTFTQAEAIICNMILNKLKELKDSDN